MRCYVLHNHPVEIKCKWMEEQLPIVDQYTYLGVKISINCSWDVHINETVAKAKSQVGRMDVILRDSHQDCRTEIYNLMSVIIPKLKYEGEAMGGERGIEEVEGSTHCSS